MQEEKKSEPEPEIKTYEPEPSGDLSDIWQDVCGEAAKERPVLNILGRYMPSGKKGDEIKLVVDLAMTKEIIERNISYINGLLKRFGEDGHLVCVLDGGQDDAGSVKDKGTELKETQEAVSQLLGVEVTIQDEDF